MYYNWKDTTNTEELKKVCNLIKNGEIIIFPTETVYGIGANALDEEAVGKIFIAKGRPQDNPLIVHVAEKKKIEEIAEITSKVEKKLINKFMPGPFTIILKKKEIIPNIVTAGLNTVAVRIPSSVVARGIISLSGVPIAAPSANISGRPSGTNIEDIRKELEEKVSAIVDTGEVDGGLESTVVKVIDEVPVILRPGLITPEDIEKVIGTVRVEEIVFEKIEDDRKIESPGIKYRHYSPETKCKVIYCEDKLDQIFYINREVRKYKGDVVILGFREHKEKIVVSKGRYIDIGSQNDLREIARNIYKSLRHADEINAEIILIEGVKKDGIGIAIMNRLLKTCNYDYFEK